MYEKDDGPLTDEQLCIIREMNSHLEQSNLSIDLDWLNSEKQGNAMYYDYYYKIDGELRRHTSNQELTDAEINNIFGASKHVVMLTPIVFEREISTEDKSGNKIKSTEKVHVGFLGYVE
ncbi:hypothetical protein [Yersinia phage fHe-Yen9-04]|uniref:Uncharacterized protein n=2 Tax=Eneladusvirus Yen904 TaxID=2560849 RepID=A0A2C9CXI1_9CAUD|nr:hypothetical protein FDJ41_gp456 [Yersinia phage fHe-Yen9-04]SOK58724.1 hypothetical protein [Yersinia phage fHe-Yen9-04]SOK59259.1 hypothetical protein [Yersinia phage fHe-Yen9-03]VUE36493.1 hypothetical protein [Yersinia phage fHe-Yen9-04]